MSKHPPNRRKPIRSPIRSALLPLPMLAAVLVWLGWLNGANVGTAGNFSFGAVDATAEFIGAPPASQMMMPMHDGGHGGEVQVVIQLRNDTVRPVTIAFGGIRMLSAGGTEVAAVAGLLGDLTIRPHAAVEERLRFPVPDASQVYDQVRVRIPDGDGNHTLTVPLHRPGSGAASGSATHVHERDHR